MTALVKYREAKKKVHAAQEEARKVMKTAFSDASKELFKNHGKLEMFSWTQYTPYFNDGDTCTFGVNNDSPCINDEEDSYGYYPKGSEQEALQQPVIEFLQMFDNDDYLEMFGDHVQVIVYRNGSIDVNEYSHD